MESISIQNVTTFEHLELDSDTHGWVRFVNHCFSEDTVVETTYTPGLYITVLGQCHYRPLSHDSQEQDNFNYHYSVTLADQSPLSSRLSILNDVLCHIEDHLAYDWTLSSVASLARSNQTYIKQDVKYLLGMSFRKWLNKKRLNAAVGFLSDDVPISQIATDIGYKSQAHFATLFKNEIGMTPSEYRQSLQFSKNK